MNLPVLNYLLYHPDPGQRAAIRSALDAAAGAVCIGEGSELPSAPPSMAARVPLVIFYRPEPRGRNSFRQLRRWREARENLRLLVLLEPEDAGLVRLLLDAGVGAFVSRDAWTEELPTAINTLGIGGVFVSGRLARSAFSPVRRAEGAEVDAFGLTSREREILVMIALGLSNKDVARRLELSVRTVETHRLNIRKKTRASSRRDLVEVADKLGLIIEYGSPHGLAERRAAPGFHEE
ncbi:MAG: response regulator transcription factor [Proteobacteria bacterium]|nr:response regulator transcription factor [Pseudomonadota bacterium]